MSTPQAQPKTNTPFTLKPNNLGIDINGWRLTSKKAPISNSTEIDQLYEASHVKAPEMVFLSNHLIIEHTSGLKIEFNARDALLACRLDAEHKHTHDQATHAHGHNTAKEESKHITTTTSPTPIPMPTPVAPKPPPGVTPITATTFNPNASGSGSGVAPVKVTHATKWANKHSTGDIQEVALSYDWTYTTTYTGTTNTELEQSTADIPMELVTSRDPILWYDQIHLYEDELHDNGISSLTLKVRVMEKCFLVLMQFWLRVDNVLIRIYDTRVFHQFGTNTVLHHVHKREETFAAMKQRGLPSAPTFYNDPQLLSQKLPIREIIKRQITLKQTST